MFFEALEMGIGMDIVLWFQSMRFSELNVVALMFHYAVSGAFFVVVLGGIYWMFDKELAVRMLFALIIIGICSLLLKDAFARPRPPHVIGSAVIPLVNDSSYGIPSGHSSFTVVVWGFFAYWMKNRTITIAVVIFAFLMGLSRMYLGVHFPQDVIAGWLLGAVVLWSYIMNVEKVVTWWHQQSVALQIALPVTGGGILTIFFLGSIDGLLTIGLLIGLSIAVALETNYIHFKHVDSLFRRGLQFVVGLAVIGLIYLGLDVAFDAIVPQTYIYAEDPEALTALEAFQVEAELGDPTSVCTEANEAGFGAEVDQACEIQLTPVAGVLRVIRYSLFVILALSVIPLVSIRLNLMKRKDPPDAMDTSNNMF